MKTERWLVRSRRGGWSYKILGYTAQNRGVNFTLHRIEPNRWRVSGHSTTGSRLRVRFYAEDFDDALQESEKILGYAVRESAHGLQMAEVFKRWEKSLNCNAGTLNGYRVSIKMWLAWADTQGIGLWSEIRLEHLQHYATHLVSKGFSEGTVRLRMMPLRSAIRWAAANWVDAYTDVTQGFRLPKIKETAYVAERAGALSLREAAEFLLWIEGQKHSHRVVLGVALQALAGLRVTEVLRLGWDKIEGDTVVIEGETKNEASVRRIPLPRLVLDIMEDYRTGQTGLVFPNYSSVEGYTKHVRRLLRARHIPIPPKDLRNTLPTEFRSTGHYGYIFERYLGHAATSITDKHYVTLSEADRLQLMRDQVVKPIDERLGDLCEERHKIGTTGKVVMFLGR